MSRMFLRRPRGPRAGSALGWRRGTGTSGSTTVAARFQIASSSAASGRGRAIASLVSTVPRADGKAQVAYNGHPLYTYSGDNAAGDTNGQGVTAFGAAWFALSPSGDQIAGAASTSSGGGGY